MPKHPPYAELMKMTPVELARELKEHELSVAKQRLQAGVGALKDTAGFRANRRQIARLKTALRTQGMAAAEAPKAPKKTLKKKASDSTLSAPASA